jgi:hypothetical protein
MLLRWLQKTRGEFNERYCAVKISRRRPGLEVWRTTKILDLSQLEDRVMLSASPLPAAALVGDEAATGGDLSAGSDQYAAIEQPSADYAGLTPQTLDERGFDAAVPGDDSSLQFRLEASRDAQLLRRELVVIDPAAADYQQLVDDLLANQDDTRQVDVVVLDAERDGIEQISELLAGYDDLAAVHLISHGTDGAVKLGNAWLTLDNIGAYAGQLVGWRDALRADADVLLYGCDVAASDDGRTLVESLSTLTGADVAASLDPTGSALLGGNWILEFTSSSVTTPIAFSADVQQGWAGLLADPNGPEFRVNSTTSGTQTIVPGTGQPSQAVATDALGNFVVVWTSDQTGSAEVYAQRFDAAGVAQGGEFQVNTSTTGSQNNAAVAMDSSGNFVVVWKSDQSDSGDIYAQRYNAAGVAQGSEFRVNTTTASLQEQTAVAMDADGDFVITWQSTHA